MLDCKYQSDIFFDGIRNIIVSVFILLYLLRVASTNTNSDNKFVIVHHFGRRYFIFESIDELGCVDDFIYIFVNMLPQV